MHAYWHLRSLLLLFHPSFGWPAVPSQHGPPAPCEGLVIEGPLLSWVGWIVGLTPPMPPCFPRLPFATLSAHYGRVSPR